MTMLISHRGNTNGSSSNENKPGHIENLIETTIYDFEIDVWYQNNEIYLGHDAPTYKIPMSFFNIHFDRLWLHAKNIEALDIFSHHPFNCFWHENDTAVLTSKGYIWTNQPTVISKKVIQVIFNKDEAILRQRMLKNSILGICTDYVDELRYSI